MTYRTATVTYGRHTLVYDDYGEGDRVIVYLHGLMADSEMNRRLATALQARGLRVVLLDLLGHGRSDRPTHASAYRMDKYADQVVALLDHLAIDRAVLGGLSLGANVSLYAANRYPDRVRALVLEMPVLEWAVPFAALLFSPLLLAVHYGRRIAGPIASAFGRIPATGIPEIDLALHSLSAPPDSLAALLHGILVGPVGPTQEERAAIEAPTLICAHRHDLLHPYGDADSLAALMPNATLLADASTIELRLHTRRLADLVAGFVDEVWPAGGAPRVTDRSRTTRVRDDTSR